MKRKILFLSVIALFAMMALPTTALADGLETTQEVKGKKRLPYPRATRAIPASAMEYDSIAGCFVVRDTIAPSRAGSRSGAARTVVTRAAVVYTEKGVKYGYFGDQLSSENMAEMKALLEPWKNEIKNLDIDSVLSPARNGKETWYMQIVGVDNEDIDDLDGEMRIYNDIGSCTFCLVIVYRIENKESAFIFNNVRVYCKRSYQLFSVCKRAVWSI